MTEEKQTKSFDPSKHISKIRGQDYLEVKWRLLWMRDEHPGWGIETKIIEHEPGKYALLQATVTDEGKVLGMGHKIVTRQEFADYIGKAETGAIGRALASCGYGTQFAGEYDEGGPVDSPINAPFPTGAQANGKTPPPRRAAPERPPAASEEEPLATPKQRGDLSALLHSVYPDSLERKAYFLGKVGQKMLAEITEGEYWDMTYELQSIEDPAIEEQPLPAVLA